MPVLRHRIAQAPDTLTVHDLPDARFLVNPKITITVLA